MDGTGTELCPVAGFDTSNVEYTCYLLLPLLLSNSGSFLENRKERYLRTSARKTHTQKNATRKTLTGNYV
jgi:F420-0:gamma-glutamyl ligase